MDPPHITEFASDRYFSKLNRLNEPGDQSTNGNGSGTAGALEGHPRGLSVPEIGSQSTFILPLRATKPTEPDAGLPRPTDQKKPEKSRLFSFRSKLPILHPKQLSAHDLQCQSTVSASTSAEAGTNASVPLDQLFLALPNELQIQIINALPLADVLNLRLASKSWHTLITLNEAPIVRYHLDNHIPAYALRLYPASDPTNVSFHHLCSLWHRLHVAAKLSYLMCEWVTKEIFLRKTKAQRQEFAPQKERMRRRLIPLLFTIFHFFETYRKLHVEYLLSNQGHGLRQQPYTLNPIEVRIMRMYDDQTLLRVHQVFPLVISSFCRQLRPPSYVGRVERSLRGYLREKPPDEVHAAILCLGGLRQVERFWEIPGYNSRRGAVDDWYGLQTKEPPSEASKPKRSLLGLGRKKSMAALKVNATAMATDVPPLPPPSLPPMSVQHPEDGVPMPRLDSAPSANNNGVIHHPLPQSHFHSHLGGLVFNTSLAAGMPMSPLPSELARSLLPDLPQLQHIWLATAEAVILERKIVAKSSDILRNAQVMLELIREDGMDEEDEWWYGRNAPDSVRPPAEALEDEVADGDGVLDDQDVSMSI